MQTYCHFGIHPTKLTWQWKFQPLEDVSPMKKMVIFQLAMLVSCVLWVDMLYFMNPAVESNAMAMPGASSNSTFEISNSPCHAGDYATVKAEWGCWWGWWVDLVSWFFKAPGWFFVIHFFWKTWSDFNPVVFWKTWSDFHRVVFFVVKEDVCSCSMWLI